MDFNHFDEKGNARMVDVSSKKITEREATAKGRIYVNDEIMDLILNKKAKKGDVLTVARVSAIMATKKTSDIIPMCHPLMLTGVWTDFEINKELSYIEMTLTVKTSGKTGVEMEALTGVSAGLLTIYDMTKAASKEMTIDNIRLIKKSGGESGLYERVCHER